MAKYWIIIIIIKIIIIIITIIIIIIINRSLLQINWNAKGSARDFDSSLMTAP